MVKYNKWLDKVSRHSYQISATNAIRLDKSERIVDYSESFFNSFINSVTQEDLRLYPNTHAIRLAISEYCNVHINNVFLSFGSEGIIKNMFECFVDHHSDVVTSNPCFPMYDVYAGVYNSALRKVDYTPSLDLSIDHLINKITDNTRLVLLANPNSPIGDYKTYKELEPLMYYTNSKGIALFIDEAYKEFCTNQLSNEETLDIISKYDNIIVSRTFSKAFGAAGIRLGYCLGNATTIQLLNKCKPAFETSGIAIKFAHHLLNNLPIVVDYYNNVIHSRDVLSDKLASAGFDVLNSNCNWIHINDNFDNVSTVKILDEFNVIYKKSCILPYDARTNWLRLSIVPGIENSVYIKKLIDDKILFKN